MRSRAYPSNDLATAVRRLELYNTNLGPVGYHTREEIAVAIGYKSMSGPASRAIASLVHYGLLERRKDKYGISDLAKSILLPHSEGETRSAIQEAAVRPALFNEIVTQYKGRELPGLLGNILTSPQYGISPKVKDEVVEVFKSSIEYAGLLNNNRIQSPDAVAQPAEEFEDQGVSAADLPSTQRPPVLPSQKTNAPESGLTRLPSGIIISFPEELGFAVITGEFGTEIKGLERKAQALLKNEDEAETAPGGGNEE